MSIGSRSLSWRRTTVASIACPQPQVRHLGQRVHPGVGAPRGAELEYRAGDAGERAPQLAADGPGVLLLLPAAVARPLVLDDQAIGGHGCIMHAGRATIGP